MRRTPVLLLASVAALASCSWGTGPSDALESLDALPQDVAPATTVAGDDGDAEPSASQAACEAGDLQTRSYRPDRTMVPPDGLPAGIRRRGQLRVAVDETTFGFAYRNADTGDIEGFEVDLAHEIAARILGAARVGDGVEIVSVDPVDKYDVVRDGDVDLTISAITMTCGRWEDVAFSAEYFTANQTFLAREDSDIDDVADLDDATVCVTENSSSLLILEAKVPAADLLETRTRADCLIALQEGTADAYFGHDSFIYGLQLQDPDTVHVVDGLLPREDTVTHYGIAIAHGQEPLVRAVNGALQAIKDDGTWARLHRHLEVDLGLPETEPPTAQYRD